MLTNQLDLKAVVYKFCGWLVTLNSQLHLA